MIGILKSLLGLIKHNFWMKVAALGVAAVLWVFVIAETNPPRLKEFDNIPVAFTGTQELKDNELIATQSLNKVISTASVTIEADTNELKYLDEDMISLSVDLSGINSPGVYQLPVKGKTPSGTVTKVTPDVVDVTIDDLVTSEIPVEVQMVGDKQENVYYGEPKLSKKTVTVSGARENIERFAKAVCYLDIGGLTKPVSQTINAVVLDANGASVGEDNLGSELPAVIVSLDVYPMKTVPIDTDSVLANITGVAEGYQIEGVVLEPASIIVAAPQEVLDTLNSILLENIVLSNASVDSAQEVAVDIPEGAALIKPQKVEATVQISMVQEEKTYQALDIHVKNLESGLKCTLTPASIDVTVSGTHNVLETIKSSQIKPIIDLSGLTAGTHSVAVKFEDAPDIDAKILPSTYTVEVLIEKK